MSIDVIHLLGTELGIVQAVHHHAISAFVLRRGLGDVVSVSTHAVTEQLGIDFGAALFGVL